MQKDPKIFLKKTWLYEDEQVEKRQFVFDQFMELIQACPWNKAPDPCNIVKSDATTTEKEKFEVTANILAVAHGTDLVIASRIAETGFSELSTLDAGLYGKGTPSQPRSFPSPHGSFFIMSLSFVLT